MLLLIFIYQVTGANRGIGYEVVKGLCREFKGEGTVYLMARDEQRGKAAVESLHQVSSLNSYLPDIKEFFLLYFIFS